MPSFEANHLVPFGPRLLWCSSARLKNGPVLPFGQSSKGFMLDAYTVATNSVLSSVFRVYPYVSAPNSKFYSFATVAHSADHKI